MTEGEVRERFLVLSWWVLKSMSRLMTFSREVGCSADVVLMNDAMVVSR